VLKSRVFLPSILSAVLMWTAFFPLNWWPLGFVAMAPFLTLVRAEGISNGRRYLAAWVGGFVFGMLAVNWVRHAHPYMMYFAWPGLSLFLSIFWPIGLFLLRRVDRLGQPPLALTFPVVWVALEWAKAHFPAGYPFMKWVGLYQPSGFAWYFLGHTQHANPFMLQAADLGGVYLISAAVGAVNGAVHDILVRVHAFRWFVNLPRGWRPRIFRGELMATAGALLVAGGLMCYGAFRLVHPPFEVGPKVALLQDDLDHDKVQSDSALLFSHYDKLARDAARTNPDLIVWPECTYPFWDVSVTGDTADERAAHFRTLPEDLGRLWAAQQSLNKQPPLPPEAFFPEVRGNEYRQFREYVANGRQEHAREHWRAHTLLGLNGVEWDGSSERRFNSARLLKPDGTPGPRYDKTHLVPFGEYVPFRQVLPFMTVFSPNPNEPGCTPGEQLTRFTLPTLQRQPQGGTKPVSYTFAVLICYEDTEPNLARRYNQWSGEKNPADFLVNMSMDSWFHGSEQHEQHLAISRFRAVEARRPLLRAVNGGISAVIDGDGKIVELPGLIDDGWNASKSVSRAIVAEVPLDGRGSPYAAVGDWVPLLCWLGIVAGLVTVRVARKRAKATTSPVG
jgi:apolipoprotein N-acyltransferase